MCCLDSVQGCVQCKVGGMDGVYGIFQCFEYGCVYGCIVYVQVVWCVDWISGVEVDCIDMWDVFGVYLEFVEQVCSVGVDVVGEVLFCKGSVVVVYICVEVCCGFVGGQQIVVYEVVGEVGVVEDYCLQVWQVDFVVGQVVGFVQVMFDFDEVDVGVQVLWYVG